MATGTIRYWAAARAAAGVAEERYDGSTLADVLDTATSAHGPELARVLSVASFLVDGRRADLHAPLADGDTVEVLPPFAGGAAVPAYESAHPPARPTAPAPARRR